MKQIAVKHEAFGDTVGDRTDCARAGIRRNWGRPIIGCAVGSSNGGYTNSSYGALIQSSGLAVRVGLKPFATRSVQVYNVTLSTRGITILKLHMINGTESAKLIISITKSA